MKEFEDMHGDDVMGGYEPENGQDKTLCVFLLDNSGSMYGEKIQGLNNGLQQFQNDILRDETISQRVEVAVISFASIVEYLQKPALVENITMPVLQAGGGTDMVGGLRKSIDVIAERKEYWKEHGVAYKRPWIVMITDGQADISSIKDEIEQGSKDKHFFIMPVAVGDDADLNVLNSIASSLDASQPSRALKIGEKKFSELFKWLSNSIGNIALAQPGTNVNIADPFVTFAV